MYLRIKKIVRLGPARQLLLARLWLLLAQARCMLLWKGLSHFTSVLTLHQVQPEPPVVSPQQLAQARELGELVALAARYTPRQSRCLTQVLVLQQLLRQRHIPGCFSLGVRRDEAAGAQALNAHAWLQCGDIVVNGATPDRSYTTLSTFSWGLPV